MLLNLTILPGDGIGPEVTEQAVLVLQAVADEFGHQLQLQQKNIGGAALAVAENPLPPDTLQACLSSSAVLMGAVGNPAFDHYPNQLRPEAGLLRLPRARSLRELAPCNLFSRAGRLFSVTRRPGSWHRHYDRAR